MSEAGLRNSPVRKPLKCPWNSLGFYHLTVVNWLDRFHCKGPSSAAVSYSCTIDGAVWTFFGDIHEHWIPWRLPARFHLFSYLIQHLFFCSRWHLCIGQRIPAPCSVPVVCTLESSPFCRYFGSKGNRSRTRIPLVDAVFLFLSNSLRILNDLWSLSVWIFVKSKFF